MTAYYNEHDPFAAEWLRRLMIEGAIAWGDVDERSIEDVSPDDLKPYTQCHFFAGIGVWSYALRQAGWPDDRPIWTASCPCQPFSQAGKGDGFDDERHLWPAFHWLWRSCRPDVAIGEQVSSKDGLAWLDAVQTDVEDAGYAFGALDLCAAGVGAPHIRQRSYWVAHAYGRHAGAERQQRSGEQRQFAQDGGIGRLADPMRAGWAERGSVPGDGPIAGSGEPVGLDDDDARLEGHAGHDGGSVGQREGTERPVAAPSVPSRLADTDSAKPEQPTGERPGSGETESWGPFGQFERCGSLSNTRRPGPTNGHWRDADWLRCRDDRWRPVEPGTFPLAHGITNRVGSLRGYGNAIVAPLASEFIGTVMEIIDG